MTLGLFGFLVVAGASFYALLRARNIHLWFFSYLRTEFHRRFDSQPTGPVSVYFAFVDHYEPYGGKADKEKAEGRVAKWMREYPQAARHHVDSGGRPPQHTFFYPEEEYDRDILDSIAQLCRNGYGDVDVHLHHDNDTAEGLRTKLVNFKNCLANQHGLLRRDPSDGEVIYGFIHGNWALDNSRPDGRWCGVNNEISVLQETGCYADFTMPSAPSDTQTRKINSIYFAKGRPGNCKSHDNGADVRVGLWRDRRDELLLVQGPLTLNWGRRKFGLIPRVESAEVSLNAPPSAERVKLWRRYAAKVKGAENCIFIKVHTHGATEESMQMLFDNKGFDRLWSELERQFRDTAGYSLHYVSAYEMYKKIKELAQAT